MSSKRTSLLFYNIDYLNITFVLAVKNRIAYYYAPLITTLNSS
jgi:hypothetical protein